MRKRRTKIKQGDVFNRLTIVSFAYSDSKRKSYFNVICECGNEKVICGALMISGNTKSCGCLSKEIRAKKRIPENYSEITSIILGYKRHAKDRGFIWGLRREDVKIIIFQNCNYCGMPPMNIKRTKNSIGEGLRYSGIDRRDSLKDYTLENVVPCCKICNFAKSNLTFIEFKAWLERICENINKWENI